MKWSDVKTDDLNVQLRVIQLPGLGCLVRDPISGSLAYIFRAVIEDGIISAYEPPVSGEPPRPPDRNQAGGDISMTPPQPSQPSPREAADDVTKREEEHFLKNQEAYERKNVPDDTSVLPPDANKETAPPSPGNSDPATKPSPPEPEVPANRPDSLRSQLAPRLPDPPESWQENPGKDPRVFGSGNFRIG